MPCLVSNLLTCKLEGNLADQAVPEARQAKPGRPCQSFLYLVTAIYKLELEGAGVG